MVGSSSLCGFTMPGMAAIFFCSASRCEETG